MDIIQNIVDGEESNTENIGWRNSCIGRGIAESNTAFLSPIFSVLDDSTSTNCYILIPLHTWWSKQQRQWHHCLHLRRARACTCDPWWTQTEAPYNIIFLSYNITYYCTIWLFTVQYNFILYGDAGIWLADTERNENIYQYSILSVEYMYNTFDFFSNGLIKL